MLALVLGPAGEGEELSFTGLKEIEVQPDTGEEQLEAPPSEGWFPSFDPLSHLAAR